MTFCLVPVHTGIYKTIFTSFKATSLHFKQGDTFGIGTRSIVSDSNLIIQTFVLSAGGTKRNYVVSVQTSLHSTDLVPEAHAQTIANNQMAASVQFRKSTGWFYSWDHSWAHSDTAGVGVCDTCRIGSSGIEYNCYYCSFTLLLCTKLCFCHKITKDIK